VGRGLLCLLCSLVLVLLGSLVSWVPGLLPLLLLASLVPVVLACSVLLGLLSVVCPGCVLVPVSLVAWWFSSLLSCVWYTWVWGICLG